MALVSATTTASLSLVSSCAISNLAQSNSWAPDLLISEASPKAMNPGRPIHWCTYCTSCLQPTYVAINGNFVVATAVKPHPSVMALQQRAASIAEGIKQATPTRDGGSVCTPSMGRPIYVRTRSGISILLASSTSSFSKWRDHAEFRNRMTPMSVPTCAIYAVSM